jgi:hypothetical protein
MVHVSITVIAVTFAVTVHNPSYASSSFEYSGFGSKPHQQDDRQDLGKWSDAASLMGRVR